MKIRVVIAFLSFIFIVTPLLPKSGVVGIWCWKPVNVKVILNKYKVWPDYYLRIYKSKKGKLGLHVLYGGYNYFFEKVNVVKKFENYEVNDKANKRIVSFKFLSPKKLVIIGSKCHPLNQVKCTPLFPKNSIFLKFTSKSYESLFKY